MARVERMNFCGEDTPSVVAEEYFECQFAQTNPKMVLGKPVPQRLFPGDDTPRTFIDCNLINRTVPPGSTVIGCNRTLKQVGVPVSTVEVVLAKDTIDKMYVMAAGTYQDVTTKEVIYGAVGAGEKPVWRTTAEIARTKRVRVA